LDSNSIGRQDVELLKENIQSDVRITYIQIIQANFAGTPHHPYQQIRQKILYVSFLFLIKMIILDIVTNIIPMRTDNIVFIIPFRWSGSGQ
jgi:hypothetical protein